MAVRFLAWKTLPLWVGIVGALVALGSVLVSELRLQGDAATRPSRPSKVDGDLILTGFRVSTLLDGQREWQVSALRARVFEQDHQALLDTVHGTVRTEDGSIVEFQGQSAVFDTVSHDLRLTGDDGGAMVRLPDGYVLRSNRIEWRSSQGELVSDEAVSLSGPRVTIQGVGIRIRPSTKELTILNRVRVDVL
jgi:LPS export ABC transporter protein LptC